VEISFVADLRPEAVLERCTRRFTSSMSVALRTKERAMYSTSVSTAKPMSLMSFSDRKGIG
jgi:hypothetical protein